MIKVTFFYNNDFKIKGFELKGHADYDEFGYDIVCSAATSNSVAVINSLESLQKVSFSEVIAKEGLISCLIEDNDIEKSQLLLQHLRLALEEISREYPKNIKIFEK
ncbi:MAG: ribosomal-processing cysteine protease Prp [Peptostreptococcus sp.]|uniref:ribosomal-processing cysteine protease Prp n=1 Tax=Peptostreptococcus sp. TaxID=1262 RepID=UPI002FC7A5A4